LADEQGRNHEQARSTADLQFWSDLSRRVLMSRYTWDSAHGTPVLLAGNTDIYKGDYRSPKGTSVAAPETFGLLLVGTGNAADRLLLSGDMQSTGSDLLQV
jgi:hypothetical protein